MNTEYRVLLVDDDRTLSPLVKEYLQAKSYQCDLFHNGFEALKFLHENSVDICVLDIKMPLKDGFELARDIRILLPEVPFLFLTGETDKEDRIKGLEAGADDYIIKPFSMQELELRIRAVLRRYLGHHKPKSDSLIYQIGIYRFNPSSRELKNEQSIRKLSAIEAKLLNLFCQSEDWIIDREVALKRIWSDENNFRERSLNVYVSKLRNYLKEDPSIEIMNIHGSGYKLYFK
ncbi:MAG: response regulator transcription factor [Saprospiraceae bacterium]|nr:response regulator transcription factor [Saprospiraceae bacterium]